MASSLFNVTLAWDVLFANSSLHHCSTKAYLCSLMYSYSFLHYNVGEDLQYAHYGSVQDVGKCSASRDASYAILCLEYLFTGTKHSDTALSIVTPSFWSNPGAHTLTIKYSVFSIMADIIFEMLFMLLSICSTV